MYNKLLLQITILLLILLFASCVFINTPKIYNQLHPQNPKITKKIVKEKPKKVVKTQKPTKAIKAKSNKKMEIEISKIDNNIVVSGIFPSNQIVDNTIAILGKFSKNINRGYIKIDKSINKKSKWIENIKKTAQYFVNDLQSAEIVFSNNRFEIYGKVFSENTKNKIENSIKNIDNAKSSIIIIKPNKTKGD